MAPVKFEGVFPILVTPFDDRGGLDLESFDRSVRFMADIDPSTAAQLETLMSSVLPGVDITAPIKV